MFLLHFSSTAGTSELPARTAGGGVYAAFTCRRKIKMLSGPVFRDQMVNQQKLEGGLFWALMSLENFHIISRI